MKCLIAIYRNNRAIPGLKEIQSEGGDRVGKNLAAIDGIYQQVIADGGQFVLVLSPFKRELPGPRDYELVARQRLKDWAIAADVPYLDLLTTFQQQSDPDGLYRDHIHLSPAGNELVSRAIAQMISPADLLLPLSAAISDHLIASLPLVIGSSTSRNSSCDFHAWPSSAICSITLAKRSALSACSPPTEG